MRLGDFPRPSDDNGLGLHWSASIYNHSTSVIQSWLPEVLAMKFKWVKILDEGGSALDACRLFVQNGIMPIVRLYRGNPNPGTLSGQQLDWVTQYVNAGVRYFESNNEPNLSVEWDGGVVPSNAVDIVMTNWVQDAESILGRGGLPAFPALTPGGHYDDMQFFPEAFAWLAQHNRLDLFDRGAWVAVHNYTLNHPVTYPLDAVNQNGAPLSYEEGRAAGLSDAQIDQMNAVRRAHANPGDTIMDDSNCFLKFVAYRTIIRNHLSFDVPLLTTEGGTIVGSSEDDRYLRISQQAHRDMILAQATYMQSAPEYYFCTGFWLIANASIGHMDQAWEQAAWYSYLWDNGHLPIVDTLKALPKFTRRPGVPTYALDFLGNTTAAGMRVNEVALSALQVKNKGAMVWLPTGAGRVAMDYHWLNTDGTEATAWTHVRTPLPNQVAEGAVATLAGVQVRPPARVGRYRLRWDLVHEGVTWFSAQGASVSETVVNVGAPQRWELSASHNGRYGLTFAFDGKPETRWSTETPQTPGMWLQADLLTARPVCGIGLDCSGSPSDYPRGFTVKLSADGSSWTTAYSRPQNAGPLDVWFIPVLARYVRIEQTGSDPFFWWSVNDISIRTTLPWAGLASSNIVTAGTDNTRQAFDGRTTTRWSSRAAQQAGMWYQLDLGETQSLCGLLLANGSSAQDFSRALTVAASIDGLAWADVATGTAAAGPVMAGFAPTTARFIKVTLNAANSNWWSISGITPVLTAPLSASSSHNFVASGPDNLTQALDGQAATRWSTREPQRPGMWFRLDLGRTRNVHRIRLDNTASPNDYPRGYEVKVAATDGVWQTVAANQANTATLDVSFTERAFRFVHVEQTGTHDTAWWSVHEVVIE